MDYLSIGSSPAEESCAQVGSDGYYAKAQKECKAYLHQLKRQFGEPPPGCTFKIKGNAHDFGTYYEVNVVFNENDEEATEFAYKVEAESPGQWDDEAKRELEAITS